MSYPGSRNASTIYGLTVDSDLLGLFVVRTVTVHHVIFEVPLLSETLYAQARYAIDSAAEKRSSETVWMYVFRSSSHRFILPHC